MEKSCACTKGLEYTKVMEIDSGRRSPADCLMDVIHLWLSQAYDTTKYGKPNWEALCRAVSSSVGGNNPALAQKIAYKYNIQAQ